MRNLLLLLTSGFILFASCKKNNKNDSPYSGKWLGTYSGSDNGSWEAQITGTGKFTGTVKSASQPNFPFSMDGTVSSDGKIIAQYGYLNFTAYFEGQISGNNATGNWFLDSSTTGGTWVGHKE